MMGGRITDACHLFPDSQNAVRRIIANNPPLIESNAIDVDEEEGRFGKTSYIVSPFTLQRA